MQLKRPVVPRSRVFVDGQMADRAFEYRDLDLERADPDGTMTAYDNTPFEATLHLMDVVSGNGPTSWMAKDPRTNLTYPIMSVALRDYLDIGGSIVKGHISGIWQTLHVDKRYATLYCIGLSAEAEKQ